MIDPFRRGPLHTQRSDAMGQAAIRLFVALLAYPVPMCGILPNVAGHTPAGAMWRVWAGSTWIMIAMVVTVLGWNAYLTKPRWPLY